MRPRLILPLLLLTSVLTASFLGTASAQSDVEVSVAAEHGSVAVTAGAGVRPFYPFELLASVRDGHAIPVAEALAPILEGDVGPMVDAFGEVIRAQPVAWFYGRDHLVYSYSRETSPTGCEGIRVGTTAGGDFALCA